MNSKAFTLIELLIVVAIIAILAAIAVPNFLEAQVRAKVSRVKADMRSVDTALGVYLVDYNKYPQMRDAGSNAKDALWRLTTPIAYITSLSAVEDPFLQNIDAVAAAGSATFAKDDMSYTSFSNYGILQFGGNPTAFEAFLLSSMGPDNKAGALNFRLYSVAIGANQLPFYVDGIYDPTNGTISDGDVNRLNGEVSGEFYTLLAN